MYYCSKCKFEYHLSAAAEMCCEEKKDMDMEGRIIEASGEMKHYIQMTISIDAEDSWDVMRKLQDKMQAMNDAGITVEEVCEPISQEDLDEENKAFDLKD